MGIGSLGPSVGQGLIGKAACENLGKYPKSSAQISQTMLLAMAVVESSAIYSLVIAILLIVFSRTI